MVADYRLRHGGLPFGWVAVLTQPGWAPSIALLGVAILLFPDGRPALGAGGGCCGPTSAVAALWIGGAVVVSVGAIAGHHIRVDSGGNLLALSGNISGPDAWWGVLQQVFFPLLAVCWLASVAGQVARYTTLVG